MSTIMLQESDWYRLHHLRLCGTAPAGDGSAFEALIEAGYVTPKGASVVITPAGREAHANWACLSAGSHDHTMARTAYDRFLEFDKQVKRLTTDWQLASSRARPEGYSEEEWTLIDRLTAVYEKVGPVLTSLAEGVPRFGTYRRRLREALDQLEDGDRKWFSGLMCDSFHNVWWQLHEDLLVALAIPRSEDPNQ